MTDDFMIGLIVGIGAYICLRGLLAVLDKAERRSK